MKIVRDAPRLRDVKRNYADTRKAERMLGWLARMSIEQASNGPSTISSTLQP